MEDKITLINSIGKIIVFLMVLLSVFLITAKNNKRLSNQIFALFLLTTAFDLTGLFLGNKLTNLPNIQILKISSTLLQMPLYYFYVRSVCFSNFSIKKWHILHALLFLVFLVIFKISSLSSGSILAYKIIGEVQYFAYIIAIFWALKKYKTLYLENFSNPDYTFYKWLNQVTFLFCLAHFFVLLKLGLVYSGKDQALINNINLLITISALIVICWFVLKALHNPQIFAAVNLEIEPIHKVIEKQDIKLSNTILNKDAINKLSFYMEKHKPYLDFDLTLQKLAFQIRMPEKELSMLINHHLGQHFFDFINEYRIKEAKAILENPDKKEITVLEILYEVGFNSKSSFYTAFKKITNQTPSQFRKTFLGN